MEKSQSIPQIHRFEFDHWSEVAVQDVEPGDLVHHNGRLLQVNAKPYQKDGTTHLPASICFICEEGPIVLALGEAWEERQHIAMAMDYVGASLREFDDGTALIAELEHGPGAIYSPRMKIEELELFCKEHIDRYRAFFETNEARLDRAEAVSMEAWWAGSVE